MNEIKIITSGKEQIYHSPAAFDEMTREQFILTAEQIIHAAAGIESDSYYTSITGIEKKSWNKLHFFQKYSIKRLFDFISVPEMSKQLLPYIEIDTSLNGTRNTEHETDSPFSVLRSPCSEKFIGYQPGFSNTTWQEFIFADQYIMNGKYREAAACLYRPQRTDYTGETDRRIPFTIYGTNSRMQHFNNIPEGELLAFVLNYKALRKRNLEEKYPFVFGERITEHDEMEHGETEHGTRSPSSVFRAPFSWVGIHRDLMGDRFYDETKFYELNVHVILNRLNTVIKENGKRRTENGTR
jgi:hypothetical protein